MQTIYLFSGLGADERVFKYLEFPMYRLVHIKWIQPLRREPLSAYAQRLLKQVTTDKPILMGLSFGGIMAIEVSKLIPAEKVIIIASVKTRNELPFYFRFAGWLSLHKLVPAALLKYPGRISNWFFGAKTKEDKRTLAAILKDTDHVFLKWAIDKIVNWDNKSIYDNLIHIHGSADKVLPLKFVKVGITIKDGTHLMTLNKTEELNKVIGESLR